MRRKEKMIEIANEVVDSRYSSAKEQLHDAQLLIELRKQHLSKLSQVDIFRAKLMQLKLQMEEFLKSSEYDNEPHFTTFLETYIDALYNKKSEFAKDIEVTPVSLSQVLNSHREPKAEFMLKLMIHSERAFKLIGSFPEKIWYQVYFQEKMNKTMINQEKLRPEVEKKIKFESLV
ncbi:hypothetical protein LZQ00_04635 [Sphingobacterium sp. SRCM116780]|uniref:hypothetical protein n=1 Tax=Sphingobacterium sp. SRCM116780 TaxID=2907623 RepID=UPI001F1CE89A|nr:hypothetical protein [Sphingobacterium sp. SRCM116780]UIR57102.1 hypothetical protein LZQ00_04635 [Sphingobacterium sp. SRCM116780]